MAQITKVTNVTHGLKVYAGLWALLRLEKELSGEPMVIHIDKDAASTTLPARRSAVGTSNEWAHCVRLQLAQRNKPVRLERVVAASNPATAQAEHCLRQHDECRKMAQHAAEQRLTTSRTAAGSTKERRPRFLTVKLVGNILPHPRFLQLRFVTECVAHLSHMICAQSGPPRQAFLMNADRA